VNAPLGVLLHRAANTGGEDIGVFDDDDGCLLFKYSAQRKETTPLPFERYPSDGGEFAGRNDLARSVKPVPR